LEQGVKVELEWWKQTIGRKARGRVPFKNRINIENLWHRQPIITGSLTMSTCWIYDCPV
jgi:hypothetical protein